MTGVHSARIEFNVLGPIEAIADGAARSLGGPRQRALLGLLLNARGRPVPADVLIDELWAGQPPAAAEVTVRSHVSRVRAALAPFAEVRSSPGGYSVVVTPDQIDAVRFERGVREGDDLLRRGAPRRAATELREALALWRGRPFGDLGDVAALEAEADRLDGLRLHALETRIDADLASGRAGEIVDEIEALLRDHPTRERLWRQLMLGLYRAGRQADALAAFHRARAVLDEELGIEPGAELQRLEIAILRQEVPLTGPQRGRDNLPAPVTSFVGRESELAVVARGLGSDRLVTLTGLGGIGKTRLAVEAARRAVLDFPDGVFFVDLAPLADGALVFGHVASAFDITDTAQVSASEQLGHRLRDMDILLVLDNCEHVRATVAELATRLLATAPGLRILATSRVSLGVQGEADAPVFALRLPVDPDDPESVAESEAASLFLARARAAHPALGSDPASLAMIGRICADLEGVPLAMELAAARTKVLSLTDIAARLEDRFGFLVSSHPLVPTRHRTLRRAMDWSYELLGEDEQALLARLSVFAGGFTLEAIAGVCLRGDEGRALALIEGLVDASLVVRTHDEEETRYRFLETVREYAAERLEAMGESEATRSRHAEHFDALARAWAPIRLEGGEWIGRLARDHDKRPGGTSVDARNGSARRAPAADRGDVVVLVGARRPLGGPRLAGGGARGFGRPRTGAARPRPQWGGGAGFSAG